MIRRLFLCISLAVLSVLMAGAWPAGQEKEGKKPVRLRVLSYNIHHGEGLDKKIDLERLARVIRAAEPDLVALQEVDRNTKRSGGVDQPRELGRLTGLKEIFERNIPFQGGDYGNAVLTRLPVKRHRNHALPSFYKGEQRGVLEVELAAPGTDAAFVFLATHLDYRPKDEERLASVKFIEDLLRNRAEVPVVLAGDLNAQPDSAVLKAFRQGWHVTGVSDKLFTFPAEKPTRQIDYVLVRPARRWHVVEVRVLDEPVASDHRPILAVLELR